MNEAELNMLIDLIEKHGTPVVLTAIGILVLLILGKKVIAAIERRQAASENLSSEITNNYIEERKYMLKVQQEISIRQEQSLAKQVATLNKVVDAVDELKDQREATNKALITLSEQTKSLDKRLEKVEDMMYEK